MQSRFSFEWDIPAGEYRRRIASVMDHCGTPDSFLDVLDFLRENQVHQDWIKLIMDCQLKIHLRRIIRSIDSFMCPPIPQRDLILRALRYRSPYDIKVVIMGHDPIPNEQLATGLAFSAPWETIDMEIVDYGFGYSFKRIHKALASAGVIEEDKPYDCCHENWAAGGVLLLNASLTYAPYNSHYLTWVEFTYDLMLELVTTTPQKCLPVLCWGTNAWDVGRKLYQEMTLRGHNIVTLLEESSFHNEIANLQRGCIIALGHHPTYPREDNLFLLQAAHQFKAINHMYPGLLSCLRSRLRSNDETVSVAV